MEIRAKARDFGAFLRRTVGHVGYLIGTRGQICTQAMIDDRLANHDSYYNNILKYAKKWLGKIVADCMGWFEMFLNGGDIDKPLKSWKYGDFRTPGVFLRNGDGSITGLVKTYGLPHGKIDTLPLDCPFPIAVCYTGHVGFYLDGVVYQDAGHSVGTIKSALTSTTHNRAWQDWYLLPWLDYEGYTPGKIEANEMLKKGDKGQPVYDFQCVAVRAGYNIGAFGDMVLKDATGAKLPTGCDGSFGSATETAAKAIQAESGLPQTGVIDAATYGKMAAKALTKSGDTSALSGKIAALTNEVNSLSTKIISLNNDKTAMQTKINAAMTALK